MPKTQPAHDDRLLPGDQQARARLHYHRRVQLKLCVGTTGCPDLLEIKGLFTQGSRPDRTFGESVGGTFEKESSDWLNVMQYHIFVTRPDTELKRARRRQAVKGWGWRYSQLYNLLNVRPFVPE
jgi:hypothetical protein